MGMSNNNNNSNAEMIASGLRMIEELDGLVNPHTLRRICGYLLRMSDETTRCWVDVCHPRKFTDEEIRWRVEREIESLNYERMFHTVANGGLLPVESSGGKRSVSGGFVDRFLNLTLSEAI